MCVCSLCLLFQCLPMFHREHHQAKGGCVMPARHEDTQDHEMQLLFHNLSSFPAWAPPLLIQRKAHAFSRRRTKGNLQRISRITLMALNIKTIYPRNIWMLMLYSAIHRLGVNVNYLECGMFFLICALNCVEYIYTWCAKWNV